MAIDVQRVLVVGAGTMGSGVAQVAARAGYKTGLFDVAPGAAQRAVERVADSLGRAVEKGRCTAQEREEALRRLAVASDLDAAAAEADLIVEAAPEDRFGGYAAGHREVGEPRALAAQDGEQVARTGERRGPAWHEVSTAQRDVAPGHRDDAAVIAAEGERVADDLDSRGIDVVSNEGLRRGERDRIRGTGRRDAFAEVTEAAAVLNGRAQRTSLDPDHRATNRTRSPGRMSAGVSLALSKTLTSVRPMSRQPPGESNG